MATTEVDTVISDVARRYLQLHLTADVGPIRLRKLLDHFGSLDAILGASRAELERTVGVGPRIADSIFSSRTGDAVEREIERASQLGLRILCGEDADFPRPLLNIADPPICICVRGTLLPTDAVGVAIVGTRRCSYYGREQAGRFAESLAAAGFTIVSGLARGIDGCAHVGALRGGGRTIAVLGNGLASVYPPEHEDLADEIARAGAVLSELPIDALPAPENFPRRNRLIAGLTLGVIVVEAGKRSGALITARVAGEYNREVFAVPGRVDCPDRSAGVNGMIRDGQAKLITCVQDVLDELGDVGRIMGRDAAEATENSDAAASGTGGPTGTVTPDERAVYNAAADGANNADSLASRTGLETSRVLAALTALQLKGLVRQLPGGCFVVRR